MDKSKDEKPTVKIGTKEEEYWTRVKQSTETSLKEAREKLTFLEATLEMVEEKIRVEQEK